MWAFNRDNGLISHRSELGEVTRLPYACMAHYSIFLLECAVVLVRDYHERQDIIDELHKADESFRDEWLCPHRPVDLTECDRQSLEERSQEV